MLNLNGKNALLTGGSKGIGPKIGLALAKEGVNVALVARSQKALGAVAKELAGFNVRTIAVGCDVTKDVSRENLLKKVKKEFGQIDILINNAGVDWIYAYNHILPEDIERVIQTNLIAPMVLTRMVLTDMIDQGSGHIINIASLAGKRGLPYGTPYGSSKAGMIAWTHGIREELRHTGVKASVICPGFTAEAGLYAEYNNRAPKWLGETTPEKIAEAVIHAIKKNIGEIIVNPTPVRPMSILDAIHPMIMTWIFRRFGVYDFMKRQARNNERIISEK